LRIVSFATEKGAEWGFLSEGRVYRFSGGAGGAYGSVGGLLEAGETGMDAARDVWAKVVSGKAEEMFVGEEERVRLLPPNPGARKVFCLAGNYAEHITEAGRKVAEQDRQTPRVFMKPPSTTLRGPRDPIVIGKYAVKIDWEAELALIIGKKGKYIAANEAAGYIAGYSVFNDVSERAFKVWDRTESREIDRFFDWLNGKWLDGFAPMGPCLVTRDEIADARNLRITLKVNDQVMQDGNTGQMMFSPEEIVSFISCFVTLEPGDVIATGTPSGVGNARGISLKPGDVVTTEIQGLGKMVNAVVKE
jgi:2-keto-4-pentenoate hydratase/2-oxohepta-3-ene-1,7-dioic acid hydratase in catechol pathway